MYCWMLEMKTFDEWLQNSTSKIEQSINYCNRLGIISELEEAIIILSIHYTCVMRSWFGCEQVAAIANR